MAELYSVTQQQLLQLQCCVATQVEQRRLREGAAAMAAELVSLRQHISTLSQPAVNGFVPQPRSSPGLPSPPQGQSHSSGLSAGPSQTQLPPSLFQVLTASSNTTGSLSANLGKTTSLATTTRTAGSFSASVANLTNLTPPATWRCCCHQLHHSWKLATCMRVRI